MYDLTNKGLILVKLIWKGSVSIWCPSQLVYRLNLFPVIDVKSFSLGEICAVQ